MSHNNPFTPTYSRSPLTHDLYICTYSTCSRSSMYVPTVYCEHIMYTYICTYIQWTLVYPTTSFPRKMRRIDRCWINQVWDKPDVG